MGSPQLLRFARQQRFRSILGATSNRGLWHLQNPHKGERKMVYVAVSITRWPQILKLCWRILLNHRQRSLQTEPASTMRKKLILWQTPYSVSIGATASTSSLCCMATAAQCFRQVPPSLNVGSAMRQHILMELKRALAAVRQVATRHLVNT